MSVFPSSQKLLSELNLFPSPHISEQVSLDEGEPPVQVHPVSINQEELHPSPLTLFPSSQKPLFKLNLIPSPQIALQVSFDVDDPPDQVQPVSIDQVELQPSPLFIFPSSQSLLPK